MGRIVWFGMGLSAAAGPVLMSAAAALLGTGALGYWLGRPAAPPPRAVRIDMADVEALKGMFHQYDVAPTS